MFGYVIANDNLLSDEERDTYKSYYCGLCRALSESFGARGRMTLTYDMTFLVLVLSSLYEPQEREGSERCIPHPLKKHPYKVSEISKYGAEMNLALAYLKLMDDWHDDKNIFRLFQAKLLKKHYNGVKEKYPRQCGVMEECIKELTEFENSGEPTPDIGANIFGRLMAEVFVYKEDRWANTLRNMGYSLGSFIYILDAVVDLDKDIKKHRFNPLIKMCSSSPTGYRFCGRANMWAPS